MFKLKEPHYSPPQRMMLIYGLSILLSFNVCSSPILKLSIVHDATYNDLHQRPAESRSGAAGANCMRWLCFWATK